MTSGLSRGPFFVPFKVGEGPPTIKSKETLVADKTTLAFNDPPFSEKREDKQK